MKESIFVSGSNYFNEKDFKKMIELLDKGETIDVSISCIGHTRNNMEQERYKEELVKHYGKKLVIKLRPGVCSYGYTYYLRKEQKNGK